MKASGEARLRRIEGRHNSWLKALRQAFARGERAESGACAIEGMRMLEEAIRSGLRLDAVFFSESAQNRANRLLPQLGARVETFLIPDRLFASAVATESPQGVAALVHFQEASLQQIAASSSGAITLVIAGVQDPGNLGTIIRSAEAFGAAGMLLGENTVNLLNWKVMRASAGSIFRLPVGRVAMDEAVSHLREAGFRLIATSSHKGRPLDQIDWSLKSAVFIGNEGAGLERDILAKMDEVTAIPHSPRVESLNAGIAASILLYEAAKRQRAFSGIESSEASRSKA